MISNTREIRFFHRHINFNSTSARRKKCEATLRHSLRYDVDPGSTKTLEWNPNLVAYNKILIDGAIHTFGSNLTQNKKDELVKKITPKPRLRNQTKLRTQMRQYRAKLKKAIASESKKQNSIAVSFLERILASSDCLDLDSINTEMEQINFSRKSQRQNAVEQYVLRHNQLCERAPNENKIAIQEGIIKIPHQWNVDSSIISLDEYIRFTELYLTHYYPNYPIEAIIGHDDERREEEATGLHTHYYLSGKNSVTGAYDLRLRQIEIVNEYLAYSGQHDNMLPSDGKLSRSQSRSLGHFLQVIIQEFANKHLLNPKGLHARFTDETEKQSAQYQYMIRQAKLSKSMRDFNYYSRELEQLKSLTQELRVQEEERTAKLLVITKQESNAKDELKYTKLEHELLVDRMDDVINNILRFEEQLREKHSELQCKEQEIEELKHDTEYLAYQYLSIDKGLEQRKDELDHVEQQLEKRERELRMMNEDSNRIAVSMIVDAYMLMLAKHKKFDSSARRFTDAIAEKLSSDMPHSFKQFVDVALEQAGFDSQKYRDRDFDI